MYRLGECTTSPTYDYQIDFIHSADGSKMRALAQAGGTWSWFRGENPGKHVKMHMASITKTVEMIGRKKKPEYVFFLAQLILYKQDGWECFAPNDVGINYWEVKRYCHQYRADPSRNWVEIKPYDPRARAKKNKARREKRKLAKAEKAAQEEKDDPT